MPSLACETPTRPGRSPARPVRRSAARRPPTSSMIALWAGLALGAGCVHERRGLVDVAAASVSLQAPDGPRYAVDLSGEGAALAGLDGCEVEVSARGRRRLTVLDFRVLAGPDGGQPFVGRLGTGGGSWLLDDANTGGVMTLDLDETPELAGHAGERVVVSGYVVGAQRVHVVWWSALPEGEGGAVGDGDGAGAGAGAGG